MSQKHFDLHHREGSFPSEDKTIISTAWGPIELQCNGTGDLLILLHGLQSSMEVWRETARQLPRLRTLAVNFPGRGESAHWQEGKHSISDFYSIDTFADVLHAVIDYLGKPVSIAGWSMGAIVALQYLHKYGNSGITHLFLCSGVAKVAGRVSTFNAESMDGLISEAVNRARAARLEAPADPIAVAHSWQSMQSFDVRAELQHIAVPTTVVHGTKDDECPFEEGELITNTIPFAKLAPIMGAGHFILTESPNDVAAAINNGIQSQRSQRYSLAGGDKQGGNNQ